jgi:hypothetical protein
MFSLQNCSSHIQAPDYSNLISSPQPAFARCGGTREHIIKNTDAYRRATSFFIPGIISS